MNDISPRPRVVLSTLEEALASSPVVVLTGARQTGKSTLARMLPGARTYVTLDELDALELAQRDPDALVASATRLTLDEVQRAPALLLAVKRAVDSDRRKGRFLLTGSANLMLMRRVSESLAGRAAYLTLGPMTTAELRGRADAGPWSDLVDCANAAEAAEALRRRPARALRWTDAVARGGFPPAALAQDAAARQRWFDGYVRTYLERDLQQFANIDALVDFRRLLRLAALRTGALLNQSELARDAGLAQPTAHRYLNLLEVSCLIHRLPPYAPSRGKRLVRSPKLYFSDVGLAAFLAEWRHGERQVDEAIGGALLENLLLVHLLAWRETCLPRPDLCFWRTRSGQEVDFVIERGARLLPIEVKAGRRVGANDLRGLDAFLAAHSAARFGLVLCNSDEVRTVGRGVLAVPFARVF